MPETFSKKRNRFNESLEQADTALLEARGLLDDLPAAVASEGQARQLVEAHQTMRDTIRTHLRQLEKL